MSFAVRFTSSASKDLRAIHTYIATNDTLGNADYVAREIIKAARTLRDLPNRGAHPPELLKPGSRAYRQIFFKPYRILYRTRGRTVFIAAIADGRQDMASLLSRRFPAS
jgi:toxin ParE1/3/4